MRFEIEAKELKNIINRASAVTTKKTALSFMTALELSVGSNGKLHVNSTDIEQYSSISVTVANHEPGTAYVYVEDIAKAIANMNGMISVALAKEDVISIKSSKKKTEIKAQDFKDVYPEFPSLDMPVAFSANEGDLINTFIALKPMLHSYDEARPIFSGFNIDGKNARCIACDSYRYAVKKLKWIFHNHELNITIPGKIADSMKKIGNTKGQNDISVLVGKPNRDNENTQVAFIGDDYVYIVRLLSGTYIDIDRVTPTFVDYELSIDTKELAAVAKEYISISEARNDATMFFMCENDKISTAAITRKFKTTDVLENSIVDRLEKPIIMYFDAKFIREAMELFDGEVVGAHGAQKTSTTGYNMQGVILENDTYIAYVLPIHNVKQNVDDIRDFMRVS